MFSLKGKVFKLLDPFPNSLWLANDFYHQEHMSALFIKEKLANMRMPWSFFILEKQAGQKHSPSTIINSDVRSYQDTFSPNWLTSSIMTSSIPGIVGKHQGHKKRPDHSISDILRWTKHMNITIRCNKTYSQLFSYSTLCLALYAFIPMNQGTWGIWWQSRLRKKTNRGNHFPFTLLPADLELNRLGPFCDFCSCYTLIW